MYRCCFQLDAITLAQHCQNGNHLTNAGRRSHSLPQQPLRVGCDLITPVLVARDLGIYTDADVSMRSHVMKTTSACFAVLRRLRGIRLSVPRRTVFQSPVSGATAAGLLQCSVGWHSTTPCTALAIGVERGRTTRLRVIKVRPHHAAPIRQYWLKVPWRID